MSKILITGTSGFIGKALAKEVEGNSDHQAICLSRSPTDVPGATSIQGDFSDPNELRKLNAHEGIDTLVHLAAVVGGCPEEGRAPGQCGLAASPTAVSD